MATSRLPTCEDPHGTVHGVDIPADQHLHQQVEELGPGLGPVPVGDGRDSVRHAGAHLADGFPEPSGKQLSDGSLSLGGRTGDGRRGGT